jgi:hypothetical protein
VGLGIHQHFDRRHDVVEEHHDSFDAKAASRHRDGLGDHIPMGDEVVVGVRRKRVPN